MDAIPLTVVLCSSVMPTMLIFVKAAMVNISSLQLNVLRAQCPCTRSAVLSDFSKVVVKDRATCTKLKIWL